MPVKTKEWLLQTKSKRRKRYGDRPDSIPANNCLTCEDMKILGKSIQQRIDIRIAIQKDGRYTLPMRGAYVAISCANESRKITDVQGQVGLPLQRSQARWTRDTQLQEKIIQPANTHTRNINIEVSWQLLSIIKQRRRDLNNIYTLTNIYRSTSYTSILSLVSLDVFSEITNGRAQFIRLLLEYYYPHNSGSGY